MTEQSTTATIGEGVRYPARMRRAALTWVALAACGGSGGSDATGETGTEASSTTVGADDDGESSDSTTPADTSTGVGTTADATSGSSDDGTTGAPVGTAGCGIPPQDPLTDWSPHVIDVDGVQRSYWVWLPLGYDPQRAYPVVYQWHGCSDAEEGRQDNNPPVQDESGSDAIVIRGKAVEACWDSNQDSPDVAFFDALVDDVEKTWCADPARRFATGYSSGSFMTHALGCARGDQLRGIATIAGGQVGFDCTGPVAALLIHDTDDPTVNISASIGARDDHLARNGCDAAAPPTPTEPAPCEAYTGCDEGLPVVWCQTSGQGHSRQDDLAATAFWTFLSAL